MAEFQIFQGFTEVPPARHGAGFGPRESKYPFKDMQVGDMLVIPDKSSKAFGGTVRAAEKSTGFNFVIRTGPISANINGVDTEVVPKGALGVFRVATKPERKPTKERTPEEKAASLAKAQATSAANQAAKAAG
jgi:hypothetical protein